jgi:hypothetical protein
VTKLYRVVLLADLTAPLWITMLVLFARWSRRCKHWAISLAKV